MTKKKAKTAGHRKKIGRVAKLRKPNRYDAEDSRERLLRAALEVFSVEGYDAATTRKVAQRAGINVSLIQRYFDGKSGLLVAILKKFIDDYRIIPPYQEGSSVEQELENYFRMRLALPPSLQSFIKILAMRTIVDPVFRAELRSFTDQVEPVLILRLQKLKDAGKIRKSAHVEDMAKLIHVTAHSFLNGAYINEMLAPAEIESLILSAANTFARGLT